MEILFEDLEHRDIPVGETTVYEYELPANYLKPGTAIEIDAYLLEKNYGPNEISLLAQSPELYVFYLAYINDAGYFNTYPISSTIFITEPFGPEYYSANGLYYGLIAYKASLGGKIYYYYNVDPSLQLAISLKVVTGENSTGLEAHRISISGQPAKSAPGNYWQVSHQEQWQCGCRKVGGKLVHLCTAAAKLDSEIQMHRELSDAVLPFSSPICYRIAQGQ